MDPRHLLAVVLLALAAPAAAALPDCSQVRPTIDRLVPADHALVEVGFQGLVDEDGDPATYEVLDVTQDEAAGGLEPGDVCPDASDAGLDTVLLRAERDPAGDGRVYHVHFEADVLGDTCEGTVTVCVPRDGACGDGGALVDAVAGVCPAECTPDRCDALCQLGCVTPPPDPCDVPADALTAVRCTLNAARGDDFCAADTPPRRLTQLLDRLVAWTGQAAGLEGSLRARLLRRMDRTLRRSHRLVQRFGVGGRLSSDCAETLADAIQAARASLAPMLGR